MQMRSPLWDNYYNSTEKTIEYKTVIGGEEYLNQDIYSIAVSGGLCPGDTFSLGNVTSRKLEINILPKAIPIPKMAYVDLFMRYNGVNGSTEWLPKGKFYIDTRQKSGSSLILECYDKVLMMEKPFIQDESIPDFPMPMPDAMEVISTRLGLTIDNPEAINGSLLVEFPNEMTMREVAGHIASANGGNFIITDEGSLRLVVPANVATIEAISYRSFEEINDTWVISRVTMYYDDENAFTAGNDSADEIIINNPWATQSMCDNVLNLLMGYIHRPYMCQGSYINPAAELGDTVDVNGFHAIIFGAMVRYGAAATWDISSPGDSALEHEYHYEGSYTKAIKNKASLGQAYHGVTISRSEGLEIMKTDGSAGAIFNSDILTMRALENGVLKDKLYFDPESGKYIFDGELSANVIEALSAVITPNLYAEKATIAELTVDQLDTSTKVQNYLSGSKADVHYIRIREQRIDFITASTDGQNKEQAKSRNGTNLFWTDNEYKGTTEENTGLAVWIYTYTEHVKRQIHFYNDGENQTPRDVWGTGTGVGDNDKFFIYKPANKTVMEYFNPGSGKRTAIELSDFVDANMRRLKSCAINKGTSTIYVTMEGKATAEVMDFTETANSMKLIWPDGFECTVTITQ